MKITNSTDFFKNNSIYDLDFPFFYLKNFNAFTDTHEKKELLVFYDEEKNSIVCTGWKNKFLSLLKPVYPPLTKEGNRLEEKQEKEFLNQFVLFVKTNKITHRITQPENFAIFKSAPSNCISAPFGTYFLDLENKTEDELFKNLHSKHRNVIRNAEKNNITIKYGTEVLNDFYMLYKKTMKRSDMYCQSLNYFETFYQYMPQNTICGVAYHNQKPEGALFIPFTKFGAFYLYGASSEKTEINGSINYLHWNTIKLLKGKDVKRYDFVGARLSDISGTKLEGIQQFKERFGASLEKGVLWRKDINKMYCSLFDNLVTLKLSLKGQKPPLDIIDQERKKNYV